MSDEQCCPTPSQKGNNQVDSLLVAMRPLVRLNNLTVSEEIVLGHFIAGTCVHRDPPEVCVSVNRPKS